VQPNGRPDHFEMGIAPVRKKALLKRFGSVRRIKEASVDELAETPGIPRDLADRLKRHLARRIWHLLQPPAPEQTTDPTPSFPAIITMSYDASQKNVHT